MTIGIYIRVSTEEQANEGYSISAQRERLKAFCVAQGWDEYKFYVDEGISGRNTKRPQFKKMMDDIKSGHIKVLLVYRLDRLTRSVRDLHNILDDIDKHGCVFRSATEIYDTSTAMGRMFITIVAAIAEWESANLGERVSMGQLEKARQGEWAAQAPYGFYKDENDKLHIDKEEIKAVKLMVDKVKSGMSFRQLSIYMDGTEYKPRRAYKWHIRTLMNLMQNPALYGAMYFKGNIYEGTHKGIMTKEEFDQLQNIISSRQNYKKRNVDSEFIYQMKVVCPSCGSRCSSERTVWTRKTDDVTVVKNNYRCQVCALNNKDTPPFRVREDDLNESLLEYLEDFLLEPSDIAKVVDDPSSDLKSELKRIENQRSKYQRAWASDHITDDEFAARMDESRVRMEELHELLKEENVVVKEEDVLLHKEIAKNLSANFEALTPKERRDFVQSFVEGVKVSVLEKPKGKGYRNQRIKVDTVRFF